MNFFKKSLNVPVFFVFIVFILLIGFSLYLYNVSTKNDTNSITESSSSNVSSPNALQISETTNLQQNNLISFSDVSVLNTPSEMEKMLGNPDFQYGDDAEGFYLYKDKVKEDVSGKPVTIQIKYYHKPQTQALAISSLMIINTKTTLSSGEEEDSPHQTELESSETMEKKIPKFSVIKSMLMGSDEAAILRLLGPPDRKFQREMKTRYIYYSAVIDDLDNSIMNLEIVSFAGDGVKFVEEHKRGANIELDFGQYIKTPQP